VILVETDDAVLLIPRDRAQDVRAVVDRLKSRGDKGRL
jgi:mannose-1-phosphate guanylyltransferase